MTPPSPFMPGVPAAGHVAANGFWHPGAIATCPKPPCAEGPEAPEDVRVVLPDGTEHGCEIYYVGPDEDGIHMWEVTATVPLQPGTSIRCAVLPAKTGLRFRER